MDCPPTAASPAAFNERRAWPRHLADVGADCHQVAAEGAACWPVRATDLSRGGVRLETRRRLDAGASLFLRFRGRTGRTSLTLPVLVVNAGEGQGARFEIGCRFANELTDALVKTVLYCGLG